MIRMQGSDWNEALKDGEWIGLVICSDVSIADDHRLVETSTGYVFKKVSTDDSASLQRSLLPCFDDSHNGAVQFMHSLPRRVGSSNVGHAGHANQTVSTNIAGRDTGLILDIVA